MSLGPLNQNSGGEGVCWPMPLEYRNSFHICCCISYFIDLNNVYEYF
jgi:hypothetical protein